MCGREPYLVRNGSKLDLVLHNPVQVREFFKDDGNRESLRTLTFEYCGSG